MSGPMTQEYDVAIVGASIAGSAAATLFGRRGLRVALIERKSDPNAFKQVCTHYIQPSGTPTLERLGLVDEIEAAGGIRNCIDIWTRWGWIPAPKEPFPYGYNIRRERLDPMLRRLAAGTSGVELMLGRTARRLITEEDRVAGVEVDGDGSGPQTIRARLVVAADGRNSRLAELAGVPARVDPHNRFAYFAYYRDLGRPGETHSRFWMLEPDVGYTFPNDDGLTIAACFISKEKLPEFREDLEARFLAFFDALPDGPDLRSARRVSKLLGMLELANQTRPAAAAGMAFVGDAALASDPVWGVGCGWALQSSEWLVEATADTLASGGSLEQALGRYRRRHEKALGGHHDIIRDFSTGRPLNAIEKLFISASVKDEPTARHFAMFGSRLIGPREFLSPRAVARACWVNVTRRGEGRREARPDRPQLRTGP